MTAIKIQKLNFSYSDGHTALENIHLEINEREKVGIIGPNGAGKSTLFLHFNGILPPAKIKEPSIHVGGIPLTTNNLLKIRKMVGLLFQDPDDQIFCPTVWEDVAFGPSQQELTKTEINSCVNNALQEVGLAGFEKRAPHHLSGGEKRRVCLAGVLACQADILVLDEPTSNLDPRGRRELITLLGKLKKT
ncbi:energy-coupling factor ABC transporter ATP-binding protein, partial [bacterium]|nr:energy-coupling factor ABC transporter ATP-binding protein [bacterium]MBU1918697.1 energy-coupling factor ABC transporter ATP-binding protein [bacterium]